MPTKILHQSADINELLNRRDLVHYIGMVNPPRPGIRECFTTLEYIHFPPGTALNDEFQLAVVEWNDIGWIIVSIPLTKASLMETVARQCGLRVADGIPMMVTGEGFERFPFTNGNTYVLENQSGHPIYRNDPIVNKQLHNAEMETVERIIGEK